MRLRRLLALTLLAVPAALSIASPAAATPVLVLHGRHVVSREDRFVPSIELSPPGSPSAAAPQKQAPTLQRRRARKPTRSGATRRALDALLAQGAISPAEHDADLARYAAAVRAERQLAGIRRSELGAVIANVDAIAARGSLTADRLAPVFMTLERNRQWWTAGRVPAAHDRIGFAGSELVWEYYPGQGVELQPLGSFGKANGLWQAHQDANLRALLGELVPLAAQRAGGAAWEYYFQFDGGAPPWTSGISQGTAIQALVRGSSRLHDPSLRALALRALGVFEQPPPAGVRVATANGAHYLLYSFAPQTFVLNGFLQAVVGLDELARATHDATASALYQAGEAEARAALPRYDTGAWSLYSLDEEANLSYHELVIGFLDRLCKLSGVITYCDYAARFRSYLHLAPAVEPATTRVRAGAPARLGFTLSKISRVEIRVTRGARIAFSAAATFAHGRRFVTWPKPPGPGSYRVSLSATDLAGNRAQSSGPLTVLPARRRHHR